MGHQRIREKMKCPQCSHKMKPWVFNCGYDVLVNSHHCENCMFNVTAPEELKRKMKLLRENMKKEVKVVAVGEGVGIRFPQAFVDFLQIKKGKKVKVAVGKGKIEIVF